MADATYVAPPPLPSPSPPPPQTVAAPLQSDDRSDQLSATPLTFAEYQKIPEWKKELLQKRKHVSKAQAVDGSVSANTNSFDADDPANDIMTNTPAVMNTKLGSAAHPREFDSATSVPPSPSTGHSHYGAAQEQHATNTTGTDHHHHHLHCQQHQHEHNNKYTHSQQDHRADAVTNGGTTTTTTQPFTDSTTTDTTQQETPFQQSHSRHGQERVEQPDNSLHCTSPTVVVVAKKSIFNKNSALVSNNSSSINTKSLASASNNKYTKLSDRSGQKQTAAAVAAAVATNSGTKMVAMQEIINENFNFDDTSEELQYGPGIVSRLRCRYLSLALRQSASKQRPSLDNLRRATSLNNLLDEEDDADASDGVRKPWNTQNNRSSVGSDVVSGGGVVVNEKARTPDEYISSFQRKQFEKSTESPRRTVQRGNDSLKRARSVEALMRYDQNAWQRDMITDAIVEPASPVIESVSPEAVLVETTNGYIKAAATNGDVNAMMTVQPNDGVVTIEDKIVNARERGEPKPKRLTSFMDETERPPPDLVKHTLRIFEATANRRPKAATRLGSGDVASKVANYKTIISQEKPTIVFPKPPLSPKKPLITPRTSSPKHVVVALTNGNRVPTVATNGKPPVAASNGSNVNVTTKKISTPDASCRSPSPLTVRIDTAYRTNKFDSPLSPLQTTPRLPVLGRTFIDSPFLLSPLSPISATNTQPQLNQQQQRSLAFRPDVASSPDLLPTSQKIESVMQLSRKMENLSIESTAPKLKPNFTTDLTSDGDEDDAIDSRGAGDTSESDTFDGNGETPSKRISKSALANISQAGTTTEFKFGVKSTKSYLPGATIMTSSPKKLPTADDASMTTTNVRQVCIVAPSPTPPPPLDHQQKNKRDSFQFNAFVSSSPVPVQTSLTSREIEKNLINREKSVVVVAEPELLPKWAAPKVAVASPINNTSINSTTTTTGSTTTYQKPWQQPDHHQQSNSMVFNFSNRKDVPDYIENDGLVVRRKRELPKPGESGFVMLGDLTVETSTDPDDSWTLGPPSPCDVEFRNDNVIIDGRSSIRDKSKGQKLKLQFNDTLTSTFEYPSESSLLADDTTDVPADGMVGLNGVGLLGSMPIGSAPLGSYTPLKASLNTNFELGVTRSQTPTGEATLNGSLATVDGCVAPTNNGDTGDSLQYLKPATDDQTVAWSEGTRVTDLLF